MSDRRWLRLGLWMMIANATCAGWALVNGNGAAFAIGVTGFFVSLAGYAHYRAAIESRDSSEVPHGK